MNLLFDFFFILGILLCTTYIIVIYRNNKKLALHHKLLILIFVVFTFILLNFYASINNIRSLAYFTFYVTLGSKVIIPVLLFFYTKSLFHNEKKILEGHHYLLVFPLFFLVLYVIPHILLKMVTNLGYLLDNHELFSNLEPIKDMSDMVVEPLRMFLNVVALSYLLINLKYFYKLRKVIKSNYSQITNNNFIWVRFLIIFLLVILGVDFIVIGLHPFFSFLSGWQTYLITAFIFAISILVIGYYGLKQTKIFVPYFLLETDNDSKIKNQIPEKESNNTISESDDFEELKNKLIDVFEIDKPYLKTDLTLGELAHKIGVTDKKLSVLLNQYLKISFYEFVNDYRIRAFKKAIVENTYNDFTIEAISNECGFKSRASFYRIFKLKTNMSPSEYISSLEKII